MATIYVSTTGNDGNSGTSAGSPKATIAAGLSAASAGDTVQVASGTYSANFTTSKGGTSGNFITIRSEVKHGAKISGNGGDANESAVFIQHQYIRVQDFEVTGTTSSGVRNGIVVNANNVEVIGNHIHTICQFLTEGTSWEGGAGIDFWGTSLTNVLVDGNHVHHIGLPGSTQQLVHGLYPAQPATNCRIVNNVVHDCEDYGIQPYPENEATGWKIVNNTVAACGRGIRTGNNTVVRNNISYNNRSANFDVRGSGSTLSNNISGGSGASSMSGVTVTNPLFTNYTNRDLTLAAGSPALNAGTTTDAPATDIAGTARPQGAAVDAGAYETVSSPGGGGEDAPYTLTYPDGVPYPTIPLGSSVVNVSSSSQLSSALSSATSGQKIVLANGTYSGNFSVSGKNGSAASGISIEAANQGSAVFSSGATFNVNNSSYVTLKGLSFPYELSSGNLVQFRGSSHHCRVTRCLFGPTSVGSPGSSKSPFVYMGDSVEHIRIDHCEIRNKANPGNAILGDGNFDTFQPVRHIRIDHNLIRNIEPEVDNEKEPIRLGVSTMSKKLSNSVIERNVFVACICEPEVVSTKACAVRVTGNTVLQSIGGLVVRHGTNSIMSDNYIIDGEATFGDTIGSGGLRFYDADHEVSFNYVYGVFGGNFQGPLLLDTGDAEGSSTNLSGHWRVIGAMVERNVLVSNPEGIRIGDNYSSVPRDCTIRDNLVVDADTGAAITQRVAPSNTVLSNNAYFATTSAAGMTQDGDGIWRKPGFGPRLTYLGASDVGPSADLDDSDGTGRLVGGGGPGGPGETAVPADVLNIGDDAGQNHFSLQYAVDGAGAASAATLAQVSAGFSVDPYFKVVQNAAGVPAVQFRVRADSALTSGASFPRAELQETRADGAAMAFDAMSADHTLHTRARITHLPAADPEVVVARLYNGTTDRASVRTVSASGQPNLAVFINGSQAGPTLDQSYTVGDEFEILIKVLNGGLVEVYYQGSTTPIVTGQLTSTGSASWSWRIGAAAQFDETTAGSTTEFVAVEHRDLQVSHGGFRVDAGVDAQVVAGQTFSRAALETGLTGITSRRWTIVSQPTPEDPPSGEEPDLTLAAVRFNWGAPHPMSDEFDVDGPPNSSLWSLPGSDWAGHAGNGRRRPERQVVQGGRLVMTGLANGDSGWMAHKLDREYGRYEARVRAYNTGPSNGNLYSPVLLIWPTSNSMSQDGEYDYYEPGEPGSTELTAFMHFPGDGSQQREFNQPGIDLSQFHNIAFEWTSAHLKGFIDGVEWFSTSGGAGSGRRNIQDMGPGFATIQLDAFDPSNLTPATFEVEFFRVYSL